MPKFIVLPCTGTKSDPPVFATALAVARRFGSHLAFLHVHPDIGQEFAALAAAEVGAVSGIGDTMDRMAQEADRREHTAALAWREFCLHARITLCDLPSPDGISANGTLPKGISAQWIGAVGVESVWVAAHGRAADLVIVGSARGGDGSAMEVFEAALMDTGRPVLIAPPAAPRSVGGIVTIAWKDTREAAGAVSAALPFIAQAERVVILTIDEDDEPDDRSPERLQHVLRWHNPNVLLHRLPPARMPAAEVMLQAVVRADSDLLVMGAYTHSRLREAVFGGFTRHVLDHSDLTVLMSH